MVKKKIIKKEENATEIITCKNRIIKIKSSRAGSSLAEGNPARRVDRSDFNVSTLARLDGRPQIELRAISVGRSSLWFPQTKSHCEREEKQEVEL